MILTILVLMSLVFVHGNILGIYVTGCCYFGLSVVFLYLHRI